MANALKTERLVDWTLGTYAGVQGGIPDTSGWATHTTLPSSSTAAQINSALSACPTGEKVVLGTGTFTINATIEFPKDGIALVGSGESTILNYTHSDTGINFNPAGDGIAPAGTNITGGFTKGSTSITVASATGISVGKLCKIDQLMDLSIMWSSNSETTRRAVNQMVKITSVSGTTIGFTPPLYYGSTGAGTPQLHVMNTQRTGCGLENLKIDGEGVSTVWGIAMFETMNCWIKGVRSYKINNYHCYILSSLFNEYTKNYIDDSPDYEPNHGGFVIGNVDEYCASGCAFYDNITYRVLPGFEINGGSSGNVIAYNFIWDARYGFPDGAQAAGLNINHGPTPMFNLYEGNYVNQIQSDAYFGGSFRNTIFRNWSTGWTVTYEDLNSKCIDLNKWSIQENVYGNILGYSTFTPDHLSITTEGYGYETSTVYRYGYPNGGNGDYTGTRPPSADLVDALDLNVGTTVASHGNWDKKTGAQTWATDNTNLADYTDQAIPSSLYLSEKPSWFFNRPWPPFDPANGLTGIDEETLPAGYRFNNAGADPPAEGGGGDGELTVTTLNVTTLVIG